MSAGALPDADGTAVRPRWVPPSRLYVVLDSAICRAHGLDLGEAAAACLRGGARLLQLRGKDLPSRDLLAAADALVAAAHRDDAVVIVNDRADIARMAGAGGVHVGQDDLRPDEARAVLGAGIVGVSTHDDAQVDEAAGSSADYIAVGPTFTTATKATGYTARGLDLVQLAAATGRPVVAIGGITLARAREVVEAGAAAVAVISDLMVTGDIESRVREYIERLD